MNSNDALQVEAQTLDLAVLEAEMQRAGSEADRYMAFAGANHAFPDVDAAFMRKGRAMDRIHELIAEEVERQRVALAEHEEKP